MGLLVLWDSSNSSCLWSLQ